MQYAVKIDLAPLQASIANPAATRAQLLAKVAGRTAHPKEQA